jgi:hypothetical protein
MFALSETGSVACCSDARKEGRQQSALPCKLKTPKQTAYKVPSKTKDTHAIVSCCSGLLDSNTNNTNLK